MVNIRSKGQRGEREAAKLLDAWSEPVTRHLGVAPILWERNLDQTRLGGYDLNGVHWMALEVKRQENIDLSGWWKQAVRQAKTGQVPVLMWRQSRKQWAFRVRLEVLHRPSAVSLVDADMSLKQAQLWFQNELYYRLLADQPCDNIGSERSTTHAN